MAKSIQNQKNCCQYIILTLEDTKCSIQSDLYVWKADGQNRDHFLHTGSNAVHLCWEFYCRVRASQHYKAEMVLEFLSLGYFFLVCKTLSSVVSDFNVTQYFLSILQALVEFWCILAFLLIKSYFEKLLLFFYQSWSIFHPSSFHVVLTILGSIRKVVYTYKVLKSQGIARDLYLHISRCSLIDKIFSYL